VGHLHGASSGEYADAGRLAMEKVAALRAIVRGKPGAAGAIWLVGADHGHTAYGGHGGAEAAVRNVTWVALFDDAGAAASGSDRIPAGTTVASLAPTIARALGVDPPRESMADGLPLFPSILGDPFRASTARVRAVEEARARHRATFLGSATTRGGLVCGALLATVAAVIGVRRRRGVAEVFVFAVAVCGFLIAGPGLSMSAVRTEGWFLLRALGVLTASAIAAWAIARRRASPMATAVECAVFPTLALAVMRGSLGVSDATPLETVLVPSFGLLPASVCAAIALVETGIAWSRFFVTPRLEARSLATRG
jgi:hypothetical protein